MGRFNIPSRSNTRSYQGPQSAPQVQATPMQTVVSTVFRAFVSLKPTKSSPEPLKMLGFGLFDQNGNLQERYAQASASFWVAILKALGSAPPEDFPADPNHTQAILIPVTGGVVPVVGASVTNATGKVEAGSWPMGMIPNAQVAVLKLPEVQRAIYVWCATGLWACTATVNGKQFSIPEVHTGTSVLFSSDPLVLLNGVNS